MSRTGSGTANTLRGARGVGRAPAAHVPDRTLLTGGATTVSEAEEIVLNTSFDAVAELLRSPLTDDELGRHPLLVLYRTRGSRPREDDLL